MEAVEAPKWVVPSFNSFIHIFLLEFFVKYFWPYCDSRLNKGKFAFITSVFSYYRVNNLEHPSRSTSRMVKHFNPSQSQPFHHSLVRFAVLHTGKRWFIICPVEETPFSSQEPTSEGTTSQSPSSSANTHLPGRPSTSRGDYFFIC